jgi:hypothetical protein
MLRVVLIAGTALSLLAALTSDADAFPRTHGFFFFGAPSPGYSKPLRARKKPRVETAKRTSTEKVGFPDLPKGVQQIVISIAHQRVTLFSNGEKVAQAPVSTGTASNPTPLGVFSVIEKDRFHRSNLYANAPMHFMQRLTWSGVAMHEGLLPGYPASHGCIRLPTDFASRLWPTTRLGVRVIVARNDLAPVNFSHSALFTPKPKPADPRVAINTGMQEIPAQPIRVSEVTATDGAVVSDAPPAAARTSRGTAVEGGSAAGTPATMSPAEPAEIAGDGKADTAPASTTTDGAMQATGTAATRDGPAPIQPGELRESVEAPQETAKDAEAAGDAVKSVDDATAVDPPKPPATNDPAKTMRSRAEQPVKRKGQLAVLVSRKEQKIFVRHGFIPVLEMPVVIENPDQPLGTHVYTAMEVTDDGAGMRWNLFTIPTDPNRQPELQEGRRKGRGKVKEPPKPRPVAETRHPSDATEALDRIQMPKEAVDLIEELLIPGSSLIISDEGLGRETGRYTEFIVLTR